MGHQKRSCIVLLDRFKVPIINVYFIWAVVKPHIGPGWGQTLVFSFYIVCNR